MACKKYTMLLYLIHGKQKSAVQMMYLQCSRIVVRSSFVKQMEISKQSRDAGAIYASEYRNSIK